MARIVGLAGSLRRDSFNAALLRQAAAVVPAGSRIDIHSIREVPLYDGDVEAASGIPEAVARLKDAVAQADGLLLVTPEYNNGIPGVFKNAIDWMSRPSQDIARVFGGTPVALVGASPGPFGTLLSQTAWLQVLRTLGTRPWFGGRLMLSHADRAFDERGALKDPAMQQRLASFVAGFCAFCDAGGNAAE
ncbi:NADPH-dependent FMN reductase [Pseudomonas sp. Hp2]|uniref:NADPH-dependent FMN reductase n=1 Tax=Pseudomonas sp. Hp2 TaxID=701189 RepID=UPI001127F14B|nr:NADPH-dependent FMN reductase [Pseudomonas sp. Hp2]